MKMCSGTASFTFAFVCMVVIGCVDADQQKNNSFLSSYDSYKNICDKIGWEPKCGRQTIKGCPGKVTAFHALLSKHLRNVPTNTIIKFEKVELNKANGYDPNTGKFTAPVDGVYSFTWTYHTDKGSRAYLGGYVDGTLFTSIGVQDQSNAWQSTSGHLVIKMKKGSQFWIQTYHSTAQLIHETYSFLSGYKITGC